MIEQLLRYQYFRHDPIRQRLRFLLRPICWFRGHPVVKMGSMADDVGAYNIYACKRCRVLMARFSGYVTPPIEE